MSCSCLKTCPQLVSALDVLFSSLISFSRHVSSNSFYWIWYQIFSPLLIHEPASSWKIWIRALPAGMLPNSSHDRITFCLSVSSSKNSSIYLQNLHLRLVCEFPPYISVSHPVKPRRTVALREMLAILSRNELTRWKGVSAVATIFFQLVRRELRAGPGLFANTWLGTENGRYCRYPAFLPRYIFFAFLKLYKQLWEGKFWILWFDKSKFDSLADKMSHCFSP